MKYNELEDLKVADLACGSGHILNECFDLLYDLYIAEGYGRGEAVENIFSHNLTGIDLDTRAKQLATFALLLKACQKDAAFADAHCMPNVLTMPKPWNRETQGPIQDMLHIYFRGEATNQQEDEIMDCFDLMQDADSLGSIMKFNIRESTRLLIKQTTDYWCSQENVPEEERIQIATFKLILALTEKYHTLIANPPYMGRNTMNTVLTEYLDSMYKVTKQDLYATFMDMMISKTIPYGKSAFVTMESWMFLSSFDSFRRKILSSTTIESLIHMPYLGKGWTPMGINFGTDACIILNGISNIQATYQYIRYFETNKETSIPHNFPTINERYSSISQKYFEQIPGWVIGYWLSKKFISIFKNESIANEMVTREGMATADNDRFLRLWPEISQSKFSKLNIKADKWFPYNKGGNFRRWYGNREFVVNWENNGEAIKNNIDVKTGRIRSHNYNGEYAFKKCITWSALSSGNISIRYSEDGFLWDSKGACGFSDTYLVYILGLLNSKVARSYLDVLSPTIDYKVGDIIQIPLVIKKEDEICNWVSLNISISSEDWDAHETSWDFQRNELLSIDTSTYTENIDYKIKKHFEETGEHISISPAAPKLGSLEWRMEQYKTKWERKFMQLHKNEEELNRQFIDIYGLQDELTSDVPLNEITILQQGEIKITDQYSLSDNDGSIFTDSDGAILTVTGDSYLEWQDDVVMKQLISYAVGCMLGRYRLDKPGLHIAHPNPTDEEIAPYEYNGEQWEIDDDGIMPLMPNDCGFSDNASARFADFIRVALGNEEHVTNLNYVEQCLGKTLEQYFVKDFWKDHKKMYQNRPIYWLFSSKKGAFQVIAYMHRMNAYTAERVRSKYLLPYIEHLETEIDKLDARRAELSTKETKQRQTLQKQLDECREYHERLQVVAEQAISFDLDDGVVVNYAKFGDILQKIK